jgi:undecaprenyl-diphosphatase
VDVVLLVKAAIMGIVEGLTEFLPISSTGHLILAGALLGFDDEKAKVFDIAIQTGAILAVILVYWQKIRSTIVALPSQREAQRFALNVLVAFIPAVVLGLLLGKVIKEHLFTPGVVATTFILGGFVILWAERRTQAHVRIHEVEEMRWTDALKLGLVQCLARKAATDFSFYLAIPTLIGAGAYSLVKERGQLGAGDLPMFAVGLLLSFLSAWLCVRWLLRYISSHSFTPFAWYRIAFGIIVLATSWTGWVQWQA